MVITMHFCRIGTRIVNNLLMFVMGRKKSKGPNTFTKSAAACGLTPHSQQFINQSLLASNHLVIISPLF